QVAEGGQALVTIRFDNAGSAIAKSVRVAVVLPPGLTRVGGDPPTSIVASRYTWDFVSVGPGPHEVALIVIARSLGTAGLRADVTFTTPNGVPFPTLGADGTIEVVSSQVPAATLLASAGVVGAALGMGGLVATERGKTAFLFLFLPLYSRLKHDKVLDHETRGMIRGYIVANPGDHYNAIKEALELPNGTLAYHIQVLQKEMIVKSVKDGKFRRFYPYEMRLPETGQPTKIQRVILDLIRVNPGITLRDTAGFLGLGSSTVSYHLERLEELERIESRREGISKHLYVKGDLGPET
ncbi:MAG TPA: winged helix-turn-helix transcriptional regulator, partial [Thermoplasmata archaeon]|nr:winged helix-turn-helix transcriptional regulator [Thermoplasmata archaeon]